MGKQQSKEETVIVQNAVGNNQAGIEEFRSHVTTTNILLAVIVLMFGLGFLYSVYRIYKRCHMGWIASEINRNNFRRSFFRQQQPAAAIEEQPNPPKAYFSKV